MLTKINGTQAFSSDADSVSLKTIVLQINNQIPIKTHKQQVMLWQTHHSIKNEEKTNNSVNWKIQNTKYRHWTHNKFTSAVF